MNPYAALPAVFWIIYFGILLLYMALIWVSMWKIYVKMGVPGWKAIVPYYNLWVMIDCLRKPKNWFWIILLSGLIYILGYGFLFLWVIISGDTPDSPEILWPIILLVLACAIVLLVYSIKLIHALSKAFGFDAGYTLGLILLPIIFYPILAFGDSRFLPRE